MIWFSGDTERPFPKVSVVLTHLFFKKFNEVLNEVSMKFENKVAVIRACASSNN